MFANNLQRGSVPPRSVSLKPAGCTPGAAVQDSVSSAPALALGSDFLQTISWAPLGELGKGSPGRTGPLGPHGLLSAARTACRPYLSPGPGHCDGLRLPAGKWSLVLTMWRSSGMPFPRGEGGRQEEAAAGGCPASGGAGHRVVAWNPWNCLMALFVCVNYWSRINKHAGKCPRPTCTGQCLSHLHGHGTSLRSAGEEQPPRRLLPLGLCPLSNRSANPCPQVCLPTSCYTNHHKAWLASHVLSCGPPQCRNRPQLICPLYWRWHWGSFLCLYFLLTKTVSGHYRNVPIYLALRAPGPDATGLNIWASPPSLSAWKPLSDTHPAGQCSVRGISSPSPSPAQAPFGPSALTLPASGSSRSGELPSRAAWPQCPRAHSAVTHPDFLQPLPPKL